MIEPTFHGAIIANASAKPKILPMVQNAIDDDWDGTRTAAILPAHLPSNSF